MQTYLQIYHSPLEAFLPKGRTILGDMSLQHLLATNRFVLENLWENRCLLDKIFVSAASRIKFRICAARKFGRGDKIPQYTRSDLSPRCFFLFFFLSPRCVAETCSPTCTQGVVCHRDVLQRHVA